MPAYILRHIDPDLWAGFKARAKSEGRQLRWLLIEMISRYIEKGLE